MQVFVSRPTWVSSEFEEGLKIFLKTLSNRGMKARTLGASDFPSKAPLDEVIEIMSECQGAIILGYPQIRISSGSIKSHPIESELVLPTEWNHIEAVLAYSKGLPLLIIHHNTVSRGIFDRGVMNAFIHSVDLTSSSWCIDDSLDGALNKWRENCNSGNSNFSVTAAIDPTKPICPNCSTKAKPIYLSKLPKNTKNLKGLCSICNYLE